MDNIILFNTQYHIIQYIISYYSMHHIILPNTSYHIFRRAEENFLYLFLGFSGLSACSACSA